MFAGFSRFRLLVATFVLAFVLGTPGLALASELFVSTTGSDGSNCQNSSSPCRTIQYAIDQALSGDTVNLGAGTFAGTGNTEILLTRDIDLTFEGAGTNQTTIDGAGTANLFRFDTPSAASMDVAFRDLALVNGDGDGTFGSVGAAIQEEYWVTLSLELTRVLVEDNTSSGDGGAIRTRNGNVTIHDSTFRNNQANQGGAIKANIVTISSAQPEVTAPTTLFVGNSVTSGEGGAISAKKVVASDVVFEANVAGGDGGAISIGTEPTAEATAIQLTDAVFESNQAFTGGAFRVSRVGAVEITDTVFDSNQAGNSGGVMRVDSAGEVTVTDSTMVDNSATGAFAVGDLFSRDLTLTGSTVNGNSTTGPFVFAAGEVDVENSTLTNNTTSSNFIYSSGGDIRLRSTTSSANAISSGHFFPAGGSLDVANSIINESGTSVCSGRPLVNGGGNVLTTTVSSDCDGLVGTPLAPTSGAPEQKVLPTSLLLGSLADNGGPTKTMALGLGSSALRTSGSPTECPAEDQRGEVRPLTGCDAGAFELPSHPFFISKQGTGTGTVTGTPAPPIGSPIDCGSACSASFDEGEVVELTASAASGSTFTGWSGAGCSGTGTCTVTVSQAETVTATFTADTPTPGPTPGPTPTGKPKLRVSVTAPKKARAGNEFPVEVQTSNVAQAPLSASTRSETTASDIRTCARLPKGLFVVERNGGKVSGRTVCWTRSSLAAGRSVTYEATVRTSKSLSGSARVSGTVSASNDSGATVRASGSSRVRVIEPKRPKPKPPTG